MQIMSTKKKKNALDENYCHIKYYSNNHNKGMWEYANYQQVSLHGRSCRIWSFCFLNNFLNVLTCCLLPFPPLVSSNRKSRLHFRFPSSLSFFHLFFESVLCLSPLILLIFPLHSRADDQSHLVACLVLWEKNDNVGCSPLQIRLLTVMGWWGRDWIVK